MEREVLYSLINQRVDQMIKSGLVQEIKNLEGKKLSPTAEQVIGIGEIRSYLRGEKSLTDAVELMKQNTRHLAKRQMTWFRKDKRIEWLDVSPSDVAETIAIRIVRKLEDGWLS